MSGGTQQRTPIVIVGGGPVGTALAISLAQRNIPTTVIERHPDPQPVPKGQNLTQRTVEQFRRWGIEAELHAARTMAPGRPPVGMTVYGTLLGEHRYLWMQRSRVEAYYAAPNVRLPQYQTEKVLRARAAELPQVTLRYGWTAERIEQTDDEARVIIRGPEGQVETLVTDWIVGCDGSKSKVRTQAGITETRADHDRLMVLVVFRSPEFEQLVSPWPDMSFANVIHPDFDGYWEFFGRVDAQDTWFFHAPVDPATTEENIDLSVILARAVGRPFSFTVEHLGFWDLRFTLADSYRAGRVLVAGDAAHSHPPYGGYGINTGIEDAINLAWKLAAQVQGWAGPGLLDSYGEERRPVFGSTRDDFIAKSIEVDRVFLRTNDPARHPGAFEEAWNARAHAAEDEVDRYEPNYEGSPIVARTGTGNSDPSALGRHEFHARPGHHLAPGRTVGGNEVFAELGTGFALLAARDQDTSGFDTAVSHLRIPFTVLRIDDASVARYRASLVFVRPDQFVVWAGEASTADAEEVISLAVGSDGSHRCADDRSLAVPAAQGESATVPVSTFVPGTGL